MKLIVGLGNPGRKYEGTRHNVGFQVLGELARKYATAAPRGKFHGEVAEATIGSVATLLLCPHTYMNNSGQSVLAARDFYKLADEDLLIICDDFALPLGKLRFRAKGSSGGQKGLQDVIRRLGTDVFSRLRIGIGQPPPNWDVADYVLSKFGKDEKPEIDHALSRATDAAVAWTRDGIESCMNQYNAQ
jgi:peptidyl-tRNA hydrolase, PTH1 family